MKKTMHSILKPASLLAGIALTAASSPSARALDIFWDGATGAFSTGANWSSDTVPGASDTAYLDNGGTIQISDADFLTVNKLTVWNGTISQTGGSLSTAGFGDPVVNPAFSIGSSGTGTYNMSGLATLSGGLVRIGETGGTGIMTLSDSAAYGSSPGWDTWIGDGGGTGTLTLNDSATWTINGNALVVGRNLGTGTLHLTGGSSLSNTGNIMYLGDAGGGTGITTSTTILEGSSKLTTDNRIYVGNGGGVTSTLTASGTSEVTANAYVVIGRDGSTGSATFSGNSKLTKNGSDVIVVGDNSGTGTLTVQDNATVTSNNDLWIGNGAASTGTVNMEGGTITTGSWFVVGRDGTGTLNLSGGVINKQGGGNFLLNGVSSILNQTGGEINVTYSADVNNGETWLSEFAGSTSEWNASGGTASLGKMTRIGYNGNAVMNISGSANYTNGIVYIGSSATSTGTLNLRGGTFAASRIEEGAGNGFINFDGGTLKATETRVGSATSFLPDFEDSDFYVDAGGVKVDSNSFDVEITQALAGIGGLVKDGQGELILSNATTSYEGDTRINAGTLSVAGAIFNDFSSIYITEGAVLDLNFTGMDDIASLWIAGVQMGIGTYGGIGSGAMFQSDDFTGTGVLNVTTVPEPGTIGLLLGGLGAVAVVCARRRRQRG